MDAREFARRLLEHLGREEQTMKRIGHAAHAEGLRHAIVATIKELREAEQEEEQAAPAHG